MYGGNTVKPRKRKKTDWPEFKLSYLSMIKIYKENFNNSSLLHSLAYGKCCLKRKKIKPPVCFKYSVYAVNFSIV